LRHRLEPPFIAMQTARRRAVSGREILVGARAVWASLLALALAWAQPVSASLPASVWARGASVLSPAETASTERSIAVARSIVPVVARCELQESSSGPARGSSTDGEPDDRRSGQSAPLLLRQLLAPAYRCYPERPCWQGQTGVKYATNSCIAAEKLDIFTLRFQLWGSGDHSRR